MTRWKIVTIVLVLVAIIAVSGSFYYLLTSGDGTSPRTPVTSVSKTNLTDGVRFTFSAWERITTWDQVRIYVSEGLHVESWEPSKDDFAGTGADSRVLLRNVTLGTKVIGCEIRDLVSNGFINQGDEFTIIGTQGLYLMTLVYEPTGGVVLQASFSIPVHD